MSDFVHLHCHSEYSLLDGAIRLKSLVERAKEFGMPACAVTDHGNLFAARGFYEVAKKAEIKPIIGCEVYVAHTSRFDRTSPEAKIRRHLVLLAQNEIGWKNLVKLVTLGHMEGMYYKPRVDRELLAAHSEGLVALSACLAGEVPKKLLGEGFKAAEEAATFYAETFPGRFYLEIQANNLPEQAKVNKGLIELSKGLGLPLVATNDAHYLDQADVEAHDILLCIQTAKAFDDPKRMRFETRELYYKSPEEMYQSFEHVPEAISNTVKIAESCNFSFPKGYHFPIYQLPEGSTVEDEFAKLCREGLEKRLSKIRTADAEAYKSRLETEIGVINQMGFSGYFLIVQDFINWAKDHGVPVGPGRGSAAGSLAAYALKITNLDPLPYNLLFERFLNPERVSMPDIDVDFCERRRGEVIRYVTERYGAESTAQITTFGTMKARAAVKDVGRALEFSFAESDKIAKLIPEEMKMTIKKALDQSPDLKALYESDLRAKKLIDVSIRLEGLARHASTHAAGVVIGDKPLTEYLPLYRGKNDEIVTQFDMKMVEKVGLIKFDFLGLRTMTVIQDALDLIAAQGKEPPDLDALPFDDEETYKLYQRGDTDGVFQVESSGMRKYLKRLKPTCFDDVIAMLALYRPGPLGSGMVDEFIKRKQGETPVTYPLPELEDCLKDTYGVIVYQEQVMKIAQVVADYTLGGADLLRRAMGKKNADAMAAERAKFMEGALKKGVDKKKAGEIFDLMEKFAEYGFNKSHSAAYALISYHTAWLKTHYKSEFMAALMTSEMENQDKVLKYTAACRDMSVEVSPPDVNASNREFTVRDGRVIFGLGAVKNVGDEAVREIVEARAADGPFKSLLDLCKRVNLRKVTKRVMESLVKAGAFDSFGVDRGALYAGIEEAVALAAKEAKERDSGMLSLFALSPKKEDASRPGLGFDCKDADVCRWTPDQQAQFEKESLGFYLASHPLMPFTRDLERLGATGLEEIPDISPGAEVKVAALVVEVKEFITKKGKRMAFLKIEDLTGQAEVTLFSEVWTGSETLIRSDKPLFIRGKTDERPRDEDDKSAKILADSIVALEDAVAGCTEPQRLCLSAGLLDEDGLGVFKELLSRFKGRTPVQLALALDAGQVLLQLGPNWFIQPEPAFFDAFEAFCAGGAKAGPSQTGDAA